MVKKTILIVGANGEVGRSLVRSVGKAYEVISWISPRVDPKVARQTLELSAGSLILAVDLSNQIEIKKAFNETKAKFSAIDAVITCSGVATGSHSLMTSQEQLSNSWAINFLAPVLITQLVSKGMLRNKSGKIIHLASIQGVIAEPGNLAYGSSKAALLHACRIFARELGPLGITVNAICPTVLNSKMGNSMDEVAKDRLLGYSSTNGQMVEIDDVINLIEFLLKAKGTAINGQALRVDSGMPF